MFYEMQTNNHGLPHDPLKALIVPRPVGWISTISRDGICNIAPYSFFNAIGERPPYVIIGSGGAKDTQHNIDETGEFVCSLATYELREQMNVTSAALAPDVDEFPISGLTAAKSNLVKPPRVKESPVALECVHWKTIDLPPAVPGKTNHYAAIIGRVVGIHIDDGAIKDGRVDTAAMQPIARLGYMDYSVVRADTIFEIHRPEVDAEGKTVVKG